MKRARRGSARRRPQHARPQHARPSVLAPNRLVAVGGLVAFVGLAIAGCAAVTGGSGSASGGAKHPAAVKVVAPVADAVAGAQSAGVVQNIALYGSTAPRVITITPGGGASTAGSDQAPDSAPVSGLAASGIPSTALAAYKDAALREATRKPGCGISWPLLAGIGRVESNHGRFAGAVVHSDGVSTPRIIGIPLNGNGTALIRDTDGGRLDGDTVYDRAVGPMQFIPSTWANWGVDANHDGVKDPFNVFDAAAAAADYLCAAGRDLTTAHGQVQAILSYNYSYDYVSLVMSLEKVYASGAVGVTVPVLPTTADPKHGRPAHRPPLPPVDPGPPRAVPPQPKPHPSQSSKPGSPTPTKPTEPTSPVPTCTSTQPSTPGASGSSSSDGSPTSSPTSSPSGTVTPTPSCAPSTSPTSPSASPDNRTSSSAAAADELGHSGEPAQPST